MTNSNKQRWCPRCGTYKERNKFDEKYGSTGVSTYCSDCMAKKIREKEARIALHAKKVAEIARKKSIRDEGIRLRAQKIIDYRARKFEHLMINWAKRRATSIGVPFKITVDDIVIPDRCPVFGFPLVRNSGEGAKSKPNSPTIDRVVGRLGYVPGNINIVSSKANNMKGTKDIADLKLFAKWILTL